MLISSPSSAPRVAFQMDPLDTLNPLTDTTLLLMAEAADRGYEVQAYAPHDLWVEDQTIMARTFPLPPSLTHPSQTQETFPGNSQGTSQGGCDLDLASCAMIWIRQNPPFSMAYLIPTYLLQTLCPRVHVINNPQALRDCPEKLWPLLTFGAWMPPTLLTRDVHRIKAFVQTHGEIVLKPLFGYGGGGVSYVHQGDTRNLATLLEFYLQTPEPVMVQKYLPQIHTGDTRVFLVDGRVAGALSKVPRDGQFISNLSHGSRVTQAQLTPLQAERCEILAQSLKEKGIVFAGADWVGDWLLEVNITSPSMVPAYNQLYGDKLEAHIWDAVERTHLSQTHTL